MTERISPASRRRLLRSLWIVGALLLVTAGVALANVVLLYQTQTQAGSTTSPFRFVNGGNYATAHGQGFVTNTYPNAQQVSVSAAANGADGASGTYALDVLEIQSSVTTTTAWHLRLDVTTALAATGVNGAYLFYCTLGPTGVPDTGASLAQGTDANGNPWAIFAPTCAGTQVAMSLTAAGSGTAIAFPSLTAGTNLLFLSFGIAVTNTGATTTTAAGVTLVAFAP